LIRQQLYAALYNHGVELGCKILTMFYLLEGMFSSFVAVVS